MTMHICIDNVADMSKWAVEYLKHVERTTGRKLSAIAVDADLSSTTLTRPVNSRDYKFQVKQSTLEAVERVTGVPWAPFASGDPIPDVETVDADTPAIGSRQMVNVYDVQAAAGDGALVDEYEAIASKLSFPPDYLRHITSTNPVNLAIISVTGGSMVPTLHHDDIVMVDTTKKNIAYDGMFVLRHDGLLKVKRLQWGPGKQTIILISDNTQLHPPEEHALDEIEILGRVIWVGAKQP
ncbi:hypothetical protein A8B82_21220 [Sulfitobacter sp. EhC04]|uniref:S24 family peptidase n=1 Tax=Sulfitobacter sp. EhC04 TaxID=1849168 RepID=UPI0007F4363D|nr:S24 family peptidase [Sulfitobacter sp. EhC04]OAN71116.1 hypothetical protein A8B82_21220 [Sulfitobacter sp. EhC04]